MKKQYQCEHCPIRAKHDRAPKSFIGRFWRWHINFCPGWKKYFASLNEEQKNELQVKYRLSNR